MTWDEMPEKKGASKPLHCFSALGDIPPGGGKQHGTFLLCQTAHGQLFALLHPLQNRLHRSPASLRELNGFIPAVLRQFPQLYPAFFIKRSNDRVYRLLGEKALLSQYFLGAVSVR